MTALDHFWRVQDEAYFRQHPTRRVHIRNAYKDESKGEFWTLGEHDKDRRRIILCRVDQHGKFLPDGAIMKIPFLAYADETIEDTDEILLPVVRDIMADALRKVGP